MLNRHLNYGTVERDQEMNGLKTIMLNWLYWLLRSYGLMKWLEHLMIYQVDLRMLWKIANSWLMIDWKHWLDKSDVNYHHLKEPNSLMSLQLMSMVEIRFIITLFPKWLKQKHSYGHHNWNSTLIIKRVICLQDRT